MKSVLFVACALSAFVAAAPAGAATTYADRATFLAALETSSTDGYDEADYGNGFRIRSDAAMSAVKGEARYTTTGFQGANYTFSGLYCAGCNGSFTLTFDQTSVGTNLGVFGAAVDFTNANGPLFNAFVTYGNGTTANFALPEASTPAGFFGLTSDDLIYSIAFGGPNGAVTQDGSFTIDNLTIGSGSAAVPEPATWALLGLGFGLAGTALRRRSSKPVTA